MQQVLYNEITSPVQLRCRWVCAQPSHQRCRSSGKQSIEGILRRHGHLHNHQRSSASEVGSRGVQSMMRRLCLAPKVDQERLSHAWSREAAPWALRLIQLSSQTSPHGADPAAQARQLNWAHGCTYMASHLKVLPAGRMLSCQGHLLPLWKLVVSSRQQALGSPSVSKLFGLVEINVNFEALAWCVRSKQRCTQELRSRFPSTAWDAFWLQHKAWANPSGGKKYIYIYIQTFFTQFFAHCGETSAWPGTCANFNPRNLAPPKHHARLRCTSFGWHVRERKSYPHGQAMPQKHWSKNAKVLGQKKLCWKCWGKKSLRWTRKSHIGTLLPRDVSLHDCRHIEIDA